MKQIGIMLGAVGAVALAAAAGQTLFTEAAAILIGVVCGIAAGVPTSLLLLVALTRRDRRRAEKAYQVEQWTNGPVIIFDRSQDLAPDYRSQLPVPPATPRWHVVSGDIQTGSDRP